MTYADAGVVGRFLSRYPRPYSVSLGDLLVDARQTTGRSVETGARDHSVYHGDLPLYAGTTAYLTAVDWTGECLRPAARASEARAPFLRALELFTDLPEGHREALYAFRCAFLHPYQPVAGAARPGSYRFAISTDGSSPVVTPLAWDGDVRLEWQTTATTVDLMSLGDVVEAMYAHLGRLHAGRELAVALPGGADELRRRMAFFWTPA